MSIFGLDDSGFSLKRLPDIKQELENAFRLVFGNIDVSGDSVAGQLIGVLCKPLTDLWELAEGLYYSQYPDTADGINLDYAVTLTGFARKAMTYSYGKIALYGTPGTVITGGSGGIVVSVDTATLFYLTATTTIQNVDVNEAYINIDVAQNNTDYVVEINGITYLFYSGAGATVSSIAAGIAGLIAGIVTVTDFGSGALYLRSDTVFTIIALTDTLLSWSTPAGIQAVNPGPIPGPIGAITIIVNPIVGLDSVINYEAVTLGNPAETDTALRIRRILSLQVLGAGNLESIRARLLSIVGITQALVYENTTMDYRDEDGNILPIGVGLPPKSIEAIVDGENTTAENLSVANMLWQTKPGGISLYGSISVNVVDSQGDIRTILFSRPYTRDAWFYLTITTNAAIFPSNGNTQIKNAIKLFGDSYGIGDDFIYQEFYTQIYSIPGVLTATIKVMLPKVSYLLPSSPQIATLSALVTALRTGPLGNTLFLVNDYFATLGTNDVAAANPNNLTTIKGSALAANDLFQIANMVTPSIIYIGNLDVSYWAYSEPGIGYFPVSGSERVIFDTTRIKGL
jgi:uncharacterized phage protein gp47/JayE